MMANKTFKESLRADLPRGIAGKENTAVSAAWGDVWDLGDKFANGVGTKDALNGKGIAIRGRGVLTQGIPRLCEQS